MKPNPMTRVLVVAVAAAAVGAAGYGLYRLGVQQGRQAEAGAPVADAGSAAAASEAPPADSGPMSIAQGEEATRRHIASGVKAGDVDPVNGKKVLYYHDPMVPGNKFDKPAKSPFMDMMLVPMYADADGDGSKVTVSSRIQQNLGLRTAEVSEATLAPSIDAVGNIAFNERDQVIVQARATGFVEKLFVRATLDTVTQGQPLAELYVPDWIAAQEEFLSVSRMKGSELASKLKLVLCDCSAPRPKKPLTSVLLWVPRSQVVVARQLNFAASGMPDSASRASRRAWVLTPLSV
jgi:Cu(I)/Ag(I) efflux system membrane fusion protein